MKVNGLTLTTPRVVKVYLPVADDKAVEFKFRPLSSTEDFETVMTKPKPPVVIKPGGVQHHNVEDRDFKAAVSTWVERKLDWEFLTSISVTDGLEWETVDMADPNTWANWKKDAEKVFGSGELNRLFNGFLEAQYITEEVMDKARARFLIGQEGQPA